MNVDAVLKTGEHWYEHQCDDRKNTNVNIDINDVNSGASTILLNIQTITAIN